MRVLILGGGGLGTVIAGYLGRAGHEVTLFVKPQQAERFAGDEVQISGLSRFSAPVRVAVSTAGLGSFDYLVVCVKTRDSEVALAAVADVEAGCALSFQNGVRKDEALCRAFGRDRVLGAVSSIGGQVLQPGVAAHTLNGASQVGELDGGSSPRGERFAAAMDGAGLPAVCVPDIVSREWYKLAGFLRTSLICALTRLDVGAATQDPALLRIGAEVVREVAAVAEVEGHPLWELPPTFPDLGGGAPPQRMAPGHVWTEAELLAGVAQMGERQRAAGLVLYPSLAQDIIAGRPTELEDTAGDALARAAVHGLQAPTLALLVAFLRGVERSNARRA
ncbi:MAG TPA: ketopantoate reductase family protein [Dehalococcoidia bacterium]|nr:ketopantoate reductase family protein [Dehalococcoidia bacterium]